MHPNSNLSSNGSLTAGKAPHPSPPLPELTATLPFEEEAAPVEAPKPKKLSEMDFDIKSEEVREIMGTPPGWLTRFGIGIVLFVLALLLAIACLVEYPDTIATPVTLATRQMPVSLLSKSGGKITHLLVEENQLVKAHQPLAVLENTAAYADVKRVKSLFEAFSEHLLRQDSVGRLPDEPFVLGSLQAPYLQLLKSYQDYGYFLQTLPFHQQALQGLETQIGVQHQLSTLLERKRTLNKQSFALSEKQYRVDQDLFRQKALTPADLDKAEKAYLSEKTALESMQSEELNAQVQIRQLEQNKRELEKNFEEKRFTLLSALKQSVLQFATAIATWEETYLLQSPLAGKVAFYQYWSEQQTVKAGEEVLVVLPPQDGELFAYASVPSSRFGKVQVGQKVKVQLDNFPAEEYGTVPGKVKSISPIARQGKYMVKISLPHRLQTNYRHTLPFSQEMTGQAQIITEDKRLIERFYLQLRKLATQPLPKAEKQGGKEGAQEGGQGPPS